MTAAAIAPARQRALHRRILRWYRHAARPLPWRRTSDPYRILVSELMLQQTQVDRVVTKYREFLKTFPTLRALSGATPGRVLRVWRGLGYNSRALRLVQLAQIVRDEHAGKLPFDVETLLTLPGIGPYTARAVACFAFGQAVPVFDTNVRRVFGRVFPGTRSEQQNWDLAEHILPSKHAYDWNQALMELGAIVCTARDPRCGDCPVRLLCPSAGKVLPKPSTTAKREPSLRGVPRRIIRGRIIEALHRAPRRKGLTLSQVGERSIAQYSARDIPWLRRLVHQLQRDGFVVVHEGSSWRINLVA